MNNQSILCGHIYTGAIISQAMILVVISIMYCSTGLVIVIHNAYNGSMIVSLYFDYNNKK